MSVTEYDNVGNSTTVTRHFIAGGHPGHADHRPQQRQLHAGQLNDGELGHQRRRQPGTFRVWLKNTATNAWVRITPAASPIAAVENQTSYSVPWNVTQPAGTYKLWVYYYGADGTVKATAASSGTITVRLKPTPIITGPATPATFRRATQRRSAGA